MIDWTKSMKQYFEYYIVDENSWLDKKKLNCIIESDISRDLNTDTKYSFSATTTEMIDECYIRVYLIATQGTETEKIPLGTFLSYVPAIDYNGKVTKMTINGYSPIIELLEKIPPIGTTIPAGVDIISTIFDWLETYTRASIITTEETCISSKNYIAELEESWFDFINGVLSDNGYFLNVDARGRIFIDKNINPMFLQPKWEFADDENSILCNDISMDQDIFDVPNVLEVVVSSGTESGFARVINDSPDSAVSTVKRKRYITKRLVNPQIDVGTLEDYAKSELINASTVETSVNYSHGYCPVDIGDCIMLSYKKFGLDRLKLKIVSQSITCKTGCVINETSVSTVNLM